MNRPMVIEAAVPMATSEEMLSSQAKGMTGPEPMCTIFLLNSFLLGKKCLQRIAATRTKLIQARIMRIDWMLIKPQFKLLVGE